MSTASVKAAQKFADALAKDEFLRDANVDLRGFPSMTPVEDTSFIDERFAPMDVSGAGQGSKELKQFLQQQIDENEGSSIVHVGENQFRVFHRDGLWHADGEADGKRRRYSAADKNALYSKLMKLAARRDTIRQLTEAQLLEVARLAGADNRVGAINRYLEFAIPQALADKYDDPSDVVHDPALRNFMDDVCRFVWINSKLDATESEDWEDFSAQFIGNRPCTCSLLDHAWQAFTDRRNRLVFADAPRDTKDVAPEAVESLEDLSDEEIAATYKGVARAFAQR